VAAAGLADPMISGRALGHTGGTLGQAGVDSWIPDAAFARREMRRVLESVWRVDCGADEEPGSADRNAVQPAGTGRRRSRILTDLRVDHEQEAGGGAGWAAVIDVKTGVGARFCREEKTRSIWRR